MSRSAKTHAAVSALFLGSFLLLQHTCIAQYNSDIRRGDNSDWWSNNRTVDSDETIKTEEKESSEKNFQILGVRLRDDMFKQADARLGETAMISRGDASTGRYQACYASQTDRGKIHLIFEQSELFFNFYLFEGGPSWVGMELCTPSRLITKNLATASGLHLGQSEAEVIAILGRPSNRRKNELIYSFHLRKRNTLEDLRRLREKYPQMNDKDFHANYDFYDLDAALCARFRNSRLIYISADRGESN
ncbi:MAG: hypothetical protein WCB14_19910 [Candidatus Acidiferrales bacterium]